MGVRSVSAAPSPMRESLRLVSGMLVSELEAATFLARDRKLNETENKMVARTFAAGFEQIHHLNRELILMAIKQEQIDAGVEV